MNASQPLEHKPTNHLAARLREKIRRDGPITFRDWMSAALYDSQDGYYCRPDIERWGRSGDYLTSPQRSPLFAVTLAHYFAQLYEELGAPAHWTIIEAGAGAGHFAAGVLETLQRDLSEIFARTSYLIDEASADALKRVTTRLTRFQERVDFIHLAEREEPIGDAIIFANELLDAFPVHRVTMRDGQLKELFVGCDAAGEFTWVEGEPCMPRLAAYFQKLRIEIAEGQMAEVNLDAVDWISRVGSLLRRGFLIVVDYGAEARALYDSSARPSGTLRAFQHHRLSSDALAAPGEQDLTTTIDWTSIKNAGAEAGLRTILLERQDKFLLQAGLLERLERLTASAQSEAEVAALRTGARDMILPDGMSASFQVLVQKSAKA
ncbi:MAG: SAM-dependent methyltransferase [Pyrinomonadaceae bacterium]|nr:SAM-dependent methyltransferase [Pyrinomonadaceae bacterium]